MPLIHLPQFVYWLGYAILAVVVLGLIVLVALKIRNRKLYGGK